MNRILKRLLAFAAMAAVAAWAGALILEVGNPDANAEAKRMNAVLVTTVTACRQPAKSTVTSSFVKSNGGELMRTQLKVVPLQTPGTFAILGTVPRGSVIDLGVTNPEYKNFQPRTLIRGDTHGVQWASIRRFYGTTPSDSDIKSLLEAVD